MRWSVATLVVGTAFLVGGLLLLATPGEDACDEYAELAAEGSLASSFEEDQRVRAEGYAACLQEQSENSSRGG